MDMPVHTLKYIHKRRGFCKAVKTEPEKHQIQKQKTPEPEPQQPHITKRL